jgi:hypothetical protein
MCSDDETRAKAAGQRFVTPSGEVVSALGAVQKFRLHEIEDAFFNRARYSRPELSNPQTWNF